MEYVAVLLCALAANTRAQFPMMQDEKPTTFRECQTKINERPDPNDPMEQMHECMAQCMLATSRSECVGLMNKEAIKDLHQQMSRQVANCVQDRGQCSEQPIYARTMRSESGFNSGGRGDRTNSNFRNGIRSAASDLRSSTSNRVNSNNNFGRKKRQLRFGDREDEGRDGDRNGFGNSGRFEQDNQGRDSGRFEQDNQSRDSGRFGQDNQGRDSGRVGQDNQGRDSGRFEQDNQGRDSGRFGQDNQGRDSGRVGQDNQGRDSGRFEQDNQGRDSGRFGQDNQRRDSGRFGQDNQGRDSGHFGQDNQGRDVHQGGHGSKHGGHKMAVFLALKTSDPQAAQEIRDCMAECRPEPEQDERQSGFGGSGRRGENEPFGQGEQRDDRGHGGDHGNGGDHGHGGHGGHKHPAMCLKDFCPCDSLNQCKEGTQALFRTELQKIQQGMVDACNCMITGTQFSNFVHPVCQMIEDHEPEIHPCPSENESNQRFNSNSGSGSRSSRFSANSASDSNRELNNHNGGGMHEGHNNNQFGNHQQHGK